jgi:hypothetical protein
VALQTLAHELAMPIQVCHFPPGTSNWNKIEHRMFCHITQNWRGRPLESLHTNRSSGLHYDAGAASFAAF